jgi:uncharacterized secreted protein with C-terminal beta-propeller domain
MVIVLDVSDPSNPVETGRIYTPGMALAIHVLDGFAYIANGREGLRVINVSDMKNPQEVGYYDTPGGAHDVHIAENKTYKIIYAYVADGEYVYVCDGGADDAGYYLKATVPTIYIVLNRNAA